MDQDDFTGFVGAQKRREKEEPSKSPVPDKRSSKSPVPTDGRSSRSPVPTDKRGPKPDKAPPKPGAPSREASKDEPQTSSNHEVINFTISTLHDTKSLINKGIWLP